MKIPQLIKAIEYAKSKHNYSDILSVSYTEEGKELYIKLDNGHHMKFIYEIGPRGLLEIRDIIEERW